MKKNIKVFGWHITFLIGFFLFPILAAIFIEIITQDPITKFDLIYFGLFILLWSFLFYHPFCEYYKAKHPDKFVENEFYKVNLLSITPNIIVNSNLSKEENIINADTQIIESIIVQKTCNPYYYKEVLTGNLIPASKEIYIYHDEHNVYYNYDNCVFFKDNRSGYDSFKNGIIYNEELCNSNPLRKQVSYTEFEQYIEEHKGEYKGFKSFSEYLNFIINEAEIYYNNSLNKNSLSDSEKISILTQKLQSENKLI